MRNAVAAGSATAGTQGHVLYWFRKALRLHDNPSLVAALAGATKFYPVFCMDPWYVQNAKFGPNRVRDAHPRGAPAPVLHT